MTTAMVTSIALPLTGRCLSGITRRVSGEAVADFRHSGEPNFVQPSFLDAAGELARRLVELAPPGLRYVTFTNSGAEAVEAALKLCRSATGRQGIFSGREQLSR